jgi:4-amino-4-deoxy-L-arabinose transferase-like glycosyltransferase
MANNLSDSLRTRILYDGARTPVKTVLFLVVCLAWLLPGLVGHDPWKGDGIVYGIVMEMLRSGDWVIHTLAGEPWLEKAPLYYWVAAGSANVFGTILPLHDAARLASGFFMAATLVFVSLAARELIAESVMRICVLVFIGCLGLLIRAHEMNTEVAGLAGIALCLYALALARRRPRAGGMVAGGALGLSFLGDGFLPLALLTALMLALPLTGPAWRSRSYAVTIAVALVVAAPLLAIWPLLLWDVSPAALSHWLAKAGASRWSDGGSRQGMLDLVYFVKILPWYAWPAWPLAAWTLWFNRKSLTTRGDVLLPFVALLVFFVVLSLFADPRELNAMPLLVPLALLGVAEIDALRRGAASALDWFGLTTFFLLALLIWVAWVAAITGSPDTVAELIRREVPGFRYEFRFLPTALAALLTLIWLVVVTRSLRTPRRAVVNWTAGITMVWMLVMTLGVPLVDHARTYRGVARELIQVLPIGYQCAIASNVGDAQRALLSQYAGLRFLRPDNPAAPACRIRIVQAAPGRVPEAGEDWTELWRGSRPGDKSELFVLYRRANGPSRPAT